MGECEGDWVPCYLEVWEEEECEIEGLIEIFRDACRKDKGRTSYPFGAGISSLEMYIKERIDDYGERYDSNGSYTEDWKKALKNAKRGK